ncbi:patellin-3-like [Zingiber officinale]|uniref:patellin-3-like n=1 Tax=Zingiber officinale TaxID=94328 RepID=UPI001C4C6190|nr:patellin-3-like [Zingiber officinale]
MADEAQSKAPEAPPAAEVVFPEAPAKDKAPVTEEASAVGATEAAAVEEEPKKVAEAEAAAPEAQEKKDEEVEGEVPAEVNVVADAIDPEKKALDELKLLVQAALANGEFVPPAPPSPPLAKVEDLKPEAPADPAAEEPKAELEEPPKTAEVDAPAPPSEAPVEEPAKPVVEDHDPPVKEEPLATQQTPVEEKAIAIEDDGAKTVEAIEETGIPVVPAALETTEEVTPAAAEAAKEAPAETPAPPRAEPPETVFIWGIPLLGDEKSDTILLKFLRARDLKVNDALTMLKNAVIWRKQFGIDALLEEDLGLPELEKAVFMHGVDKEGHPVCYNVYGEFQDKELYEKAFGDEEKRQKFLKWRIQYLEKGIRELLDFTPGGISSMVQVTDLKNTPRLGKHRQATNKAVTLFQDNYPEFIAKKVFINVPWWYLAFNRMLSPFLTQRTKSKFVFAGPSKSADTLFKYIAPEQVPVAFGGLSKANDPDFTTTDAVTEVTIKPSSKQSIEIPATEGTTLLWELRVLGWEVSYGVEFVPSAEGGYTVIVEKNRKLIATDDSVIKTSFKIGEPGKVLLNIDNLTSKKKKLLYRLKTTTSVEST